MPSWRAMRACRWHCNCCFIRAARPIRSIRPTPALPGAWCWRRPPSAGFSTTMPAAARSARTGASPPCSRRMSTAWRRRGSAWPRTIRWSMRAGLTPPNRAWPGGRGERVGVGEYDRLVDEGVAYADKLRLAGVAVELDIYRGVTHEFIKMGRAIPEARQAHADAARALRRAFVEE